jgi:hypothetical protein
MKRQKEKSSFMPQHDYALQLQSAVSWLGDRYLLAEPAPRVQEKAQPFFFQPRRWHDTGRSIGPRSRKH